MDAGEEPDMPGFLDYRAGLQKRVDQLKCRLEADDLHMSVNGESDSARESSMSGWPPFARS